MKISFHFHFGKIQEWVALSQLKNIYIYKVWVCACVYVSTGACRALDTESRVGLHAPVSRLT